MEEPTDPPAAETHNQFTIIPVRDDFHLGAVSSLFAAYAESLDIDLSFQFFQTELESLPGKYAPEEGGEILLASDSSGVPIGCVALRSLDKANGHCEMKRLFVGPAGRGLGLGKGLVSAIINVARERGYRAMKLDTLPTMTAALALYGRFGFVETEPYYENPIIGAVFFSKELQILRNAMPITSRWEHMLSDSTAFTQGLSSRQVELAKFTTQVLADMGSDFASTATRG